jgi:hypothetical protein
MEQIFRQILRRITKVWRTSHDHPHIIVDDTEATGRSQSLVQMGWSEGRVERRTVLYADGARL